MGLQMKTILRSSYDDFFRASIVAMVTAWAMASICTAIRNTLVVLRGFFVRMPASICVYLRSYSLLLWIPIIGWNGVAAAPPREASAATPAYTLDAGGMRDVDELYLLGTLQGIVNRDAPRLFLTNVDPSICVGADNVFASYLQTEKGFTFTPLKSLNEAIATFSAMKRRDGTPLIKGLVKYQPSYWDFAKNKRIDFYYHSWIAANLAAQEDLLPVTPDILNNKTGMLSGADHWYEDKSEAGWSPMFVNICKSPEGLKIATAKSARAERAYAFKSVYLDLAVTPKIEVAVSDLTLGGCWSLSINMGSTVKTFENRGAMTAPRLTKVSGTGIFVVDLAESGLFNPAAGRAQLRISPVHPGHFVTVKSIRFLDAHGNVPKTPTDSQPKDEFRSLAVKHDLIANPPYAEDEESACAWSLEKQRPVCDPGSFGTFPGGSWILQGLDYAIARKVYLFHQAKEPFTRDRYPNLDKLLASLQPPRLVFGWIGSEDYSCAKLGQYGARYAGGGGPENMSFWQWVPLKKQGQPRRFPQVRRVSRLENKVYVNFSWASADAFQISYSLMAGYWEDPNRGKVPMTWGFNPLYARFAPSIPEFFAAKATPMDSCWAFTAGYTHPSAMSPAHLGYYAEDTRNLISKLGLSPAVDYWDCGNHFARVHEALGAKTSPHPVRLISVLPDGSTASDTSWLDNGCPIVRLDRGLFSVWGDDGVTTPEKLVELLQTAAAKHPETGPQFLTINCRFSPTFVQSVSALLPKAFVIVGMPDFIGLAEEAGGLTATPYCDAVGSGDQIKISVRLHNASGATGGRGVVSWNLPPGWHSSPEDWVHGKVPEGAFLENVVTLIPPAGMPKGKTQFTFKDSRFAWERQITLNTYPEGKTITDCESPNGWTAADGATCSMQRGMLKIAPKTMLRRYDSFNGVRPGNNGSVSYAVGEADLDREPLLEISIPDQDSSSTQISLSDEAGETKVCGAAGSPGFVTIDLKSKTRWSGVKKLTLHLHPATNYGEIVRVRSVKLCYGQGVIKQIGNNISKP